MSRTEQILIAVACIVLVGSVVVHSTYRELLFSERVADEDAIARVVQSTNQTRRRAPDSFEFQGIKSNTGLANGDYIYSGEKSQLLVKFISGTRILIGEQSLVVLREVNGTPDLLIEQGAISGTFEQEGAIEVQTKKEAVILNGEKDAQFYVSYLHGGGLEIGSVERNIKLEYNGETVTLKKQKARVSKEKGIETDKSQGNDGPATADSQNPGSGPMPAGLDVGEETAKDRITLVPPYPKNEQIFLHSKGGKIPVFPKGQCQGACEIRLSLNGKASVSKKFERDMVPFLFLNVQPGIQAEVSWEFSDGTDVTSGRFEVLNNNEASFQKAFQSNRPIEVMN